MVDYSPEKIENAIMKANLEVEEEDQASHTQIRNIVKYIENLGKKRNQITIMQRILSKVICIMEMNYTSIMSSYNSIRK